MKYLLVITALLVGAKLKAQYIPDTIPKSEVHTQRIDIIPLLSSSTSFGFWSSSLNSQRFNAEDFRNAIINIHFKKSISPSAQKLDYGYGVEFLSNFGTKAKARVIQGYAQLGYKGVIFTIGRKEEQFGLYDNPLGFGHLTNSNNALPMDKVSLSTNGWLASPLLGHLFSYKAYWSHGQFENNRVQGGAYLHQKSFHFRFRPGQTGIEFQGGLIHNAQWAGFNSENQTSQPAGFKNYLKIIAASSGGSDALQTDQLNALGNHLGAYDLKLKYNFKNWVISTDFVFPWEDSSGLNPKNWHDGLFGLSLENKGLKLPISSLRLEFVRTTNQNAHKVGDDGIPFLEPDHFFNNGVYQSGWTYHGVVKGSPIFLFIDGSNEIQNSIEGLSISTTGQIGKMKYGLSYRGFENFGTVFDPLEETIKVNSILLNASFTLLSDYQVGLISEYNWGNRTGRLFSTRLSVSRDLGLW